MSKPQHLSDYLTRNATKLGSKPALVCADKTLSWSQLSDEVEIAANAIASHLPSDKQQIVGLLFSNGWEYVVTYLAIIHSGHMAFPLDPTYKELELQAIIEQVNPRLIITNSVYAPKLPRTDTWLLAEMRTGSAKPLVPLRLDPAKQIASLTFTSGTTGTPKLAPYTHANHIWNIVVCSQVWRWSAKDSLLLSLPMSHWYALVMGISGALYHGNTLYLDEWFDPRTTLETLSRGKITMFTHFPLAYREILELDDYASYDLGKVRTFISGGAPLTPAIAKKFKQRFGASILETYGSSETGRIAANSASNHIYGSPGKILPEVKLRLSETSELLVKSPGVFPGYFNNPRATAASLDHDGWWRTGDIAEIKSNRVFLRGRVQEKIRRFGYSLSPRDIEWAMHKFNKIKDIYVMGVQRPAQPNDELVYFIDGTASAEEIRIFCKVNLPYAWRPDRIIMIDAIPKTRSGKTRLAALREQVATTAGG